MSMIFLYFFLLQIATSAVFCTYIVHECSMQEYLSLHISIMPSRAAVQRIHLFSVFSLHAFYICECVPLGTRIETAASDKRPADLSPWLLQFDQKLIRNTFFKLECIACTNNCFIIGGIVHTVNQFTAIHGINASNTWC